MATRVHGSCPHESPPQRLTTRGCEEGEEGECGDRGGCVSSSGPSRRGPLRLTHRTLWCHFSASPRDGSRHCPHTTGVAGLREVPAAVLSKASSGPGSQHRDHHR
ncbi:hypothetical protein NDU88_007334 [Pleurodeles waltl]|uniref:Uncharacterized protein n=1 Tax=Pleurodeles waltl TaxID=8319 RepID=A0AAV7PL21_PLEWA|nr:hypothetical protein NDU88_007334 [Pleurodeles waltl]